MIESNAMAGNRSSILFSFAGVAAGVLLVFILSPGAAWYGENQHRTRDFETAPRVESTATAQTGYIVLEGTPTPTKSLSCPALPPDTTTTSQCLAVKTSVQTYQASRERYCGRPTNAMTIIADLGQECTNGNSNCQHCYQVEKKAWQEVSNSKAYTPFQLGNYTVTPTDDATLPGATTSTVTTRTAATVTPPTTASPISPTKPSTVIDGSPTSPVGQYDSTATVGDTRSVYTVLPLGDVVVAGTAENGKISGSDHGRPFVVSGLSYTGTREHLHNIDRAAKWGLRVVSLLAMSFGILLLFGPLLAVVDIARLIPVFGKYLSDGVSGVVKVLLGLIGAMIWSVMFIIIYTLNNIYLLIGLLILIIGAAGWLWQKRKTLPVTPPNSP